MSTWAPIMITKLAVIALADTLRRCNEEWEHVCTQSFCNLWIFFLRNWAECHSRTCEGQNICYSCLCLWFVDNIWFAIMMSTWAPIMITKLAVIALADTLRRCNEEWEHACTQSFCNLWILFLRNWAECHLRTCEGQNICYSSLCLWFANQYLICNCDVKIMM
jgi:hypothetical protein